MINIRFVTSLFIFLALVSCSANAEVTQPTGTTTVHPLGSAISSKTKTPTETPTVQPTLTLIPASTPLVMIPPYRTKQVILEYTRIGGALGSPSYVFHGFFRNAPEHIRFVLYADGQFILQESSRPILTKTLSEAESTKLLSLLDKKGFYSVETNGKADLTDPIYDFHGQYDQVKITDGITSCLSATTTISKTVCYYEPYKDFLLPQLRELFQFVYDYAPSNMKIYQPDRLLVFVTKGHGFYDSYVAEPTESLPWLPDLPSLETAEEKYMYVEGENATKVFSLFETRFWPKVFREAGQDYSVFIDVILPHEKSMQP